MVSPENIKILDTIRNQEKADAWMQRASAALNSFQFPSALKWIEKAIENDRHPHHLSEYAYYLYINGKTEPIDEVLKEAYELTQVINLKVKIKTFSCTFNLDSKNISSSLEPAKNIIEILYSSEMENQERIEIFLKFLHQLSEELVLKRDRALLIQLLENIEQTLNAFIKPIDTANYIASALMSAWASDEAHHFLDRAILNGNLSPKDTASAFVGKGRLFATYGDQREAIKSFEQGLKIIKELKDKKDKEFVAAIYAELAISYSILMEITNAGKMIQLACVLDPMNRNYSDIKIKIDAFLTNFLSYESITDEEIKTVFKSAETRVLDLYSKIDESSGFDFGPEIGLYAKGIEMILGEKIVPFVKAAVIKKYNIIHPQDVWRSPVNGVPFKNIFNPVGTNTGSIALGQWAEMGSHIENPINQEILDLCKQKYGDDFERIVISACQKIYKERNQSSHNKIKTKKEVLDKRKEIIEPVNKLITLFYSK